MEKAEHLAAALGGTGGAPRGAAGREMSRVDVVISGTGAPGLVVRRDDVAAAQVGRRHRPLFLIDIAVPRDIEPEAGKVKGVFLYDLDDLRSVSDANLRERQKEAAQAEAILDEEIASVPRVAALSRRGAAARGAAQPGGRDPARGDREGPPPPGGADPRAGEGPRRGDQRHRQQAAPFAHRRAQEDGEQPPRARTRWGSSGGCSACEVGRGGTSPMSRIRIGTRGSLLARWQAEHVRDRLTRPGARGGAGRDHHHRGPTARSAPRGGGRQGGVPQGDRGGPAGRRGGPGGPLPEGRAHGAARGARAVRHAREGGPPRRLALATARSWRSSRRGDRRHHEPPADRPGARGAPRPRGRRPAGQRGHPPSPPAGGATSTPSSWRWPGSCAWAGRTR